MRVRQPMAACEARSAPSVADRGVTEKAKPARVAYGQELGVETKTQNRPMDVARQLCKDMAEKVAAGLGPVPYS